MNKVLVLILLTAVAFSAGHGATHQLVEPESLPGNGACLLAIAHGVGTCLARIDEDGKVKIYDADRARKLMDQITAALPRTSWPELDGDGEYEVHGANYGHWPQTDVMPPERGDNRE